MSATTQILLEQLEELKIAITTKQIKGEDASELIARMSALQEKLMVNSQALTEAKHILKG